MKKICKIIPLPVDRDIQVGDIGKLKGYEEYWYCTRVDRSIENDWQPQQLIVVVEEEPTNGNWIVDHNNKICRYDSAFILHLQHDCNYNNENFKERLKLFFKKIIASKIKLEGVPTLRQEDIIEWCKNPSEEIKVEYEKIYHVNRKGITEFQDTKGFYSWKIKLISNNEIICSIPNNEFREALDWWHNLPFERYNRKDQITLLRKYGHGDLESDDELEDSEIFAIFKAEKKIEQEYLDNIKEYEPEIIKGYTQVLGNKPVEKGKLSRKYTQKEVDERLDEQAAVTTNQLLKKLYTEKETYSVLHDLMIDIKFNGVIINDDIDLKNWFEKKHKK